MNNSDIQNLLDEVNFACNMKSQADMLSDLKTFSIANLDDMQEVIKRNPIGLYDQIKDYKHLKAKYPEKYYVFISHKSQDYPFAKRVFDMYENIGKKAFLSESDLPRIDNSDYADEINIALDNSEHLVVVASNSEYLETEYVKYEWSSFANEKKSGRKNGGNIFTVYLGNIDMSTLPYELRQHQAYNIEDFIKQKSMVNNLLK